MKKSLSLISLLLIPFFLKGQMPLTGYSLEMAHLMKKLLYESIIFSPDLSNNKKFHIVTILNTSLEMSYSPGFNSHLYNLKETTDDTISIRILKQDVPLNYYIYSDINDGFTKQLKGEKYAEFFTRSDSTYLSMAYANPDDYFNKKNYDIIRIYEPFDKWFSIYKSVYIWTNGAEAVVPVRYEYWNNDGDLIVNYFIFNLQLVDRKFKIISSSCLTLESDKI